MIAGSKCEKLEFIINEEELDEINFILRKSAFEKKAHLINFSTKKNINVEMFYSFLTSALFEDNYLGHLSEDLLELMLPNDYDTAEKLSEKFPKMTEKYPGQLIKKGKRMIGNNNRENYQSGAHKLNRINLHIWLKILFSN
jgi:molybdopterin converting factor small subunit